MRTACPRRSASSYTDLGVEGTHRQMLEDSLWVQDIVAHLLGHELD